MATPNIASNGNGQVVSGLTDATKFALLLSKAKANGPLNIEQTAGVTLDAATTVKAGTVLTLTEAGSITTSTSANDLTVKGQVVAGDLVITGGTAAGVVTETAVGIVISATDGLTIGAGDKITIPANSSIILGGDTGITLGAGTYESETDTTKIEIASDTQKPTLTFGGTNAATFNVGAAAGEGGLLTVGSASAIVGVHASGDEVFTKNTADPAPAATVLSVKIAANATITNANGNDGGITLTSGKIAAKQNPTVPGVGGTTNLQLTFASTAWAKGSYTD
jgi:hypothetical protein